MIPAWKLRREWQRLGQKLRFIPEAISEPLRQRRHDANRAAVLRITPGALALRPKLALLLLHQPGGVAASTFATCAHLSAQGYAPMLVSNAPLSDADRDALAARAWKVIERPNYGYDFGGYRDGILCLFDWGVVPQRMLILNDSIWLPLQQDSRLIARLEQVEAGLAGTILRQRPATSAKAARGMDRIRFLESYLYCLPGSTFSHPAFGRYWRDYRLSDNKYKVIRRGERDFSMQMAAAGVRVAALFGDDDLLAALAQAGPETLRKTLIYAAHTDAALHRDCDDLLARYAATSEWQALALDHVRRGLQRGVLNSAFCYPTMALLGGDFLKKSGERVNRLWRGRYLAAIAAGDLPPPTADLLAEISARPTLTQSDTGPTP